MNACRICGHDRERHRGGISFWSGRRYRGECRECAKLRDDGTVFVAVCHRFHSEPKPNKSIGQRKQKTWYRDKETRVQREMANFRSALRSIATAPRACETCHEYPKDCTCKPLDSSPDQSFVELLKASFPKSKRYGERFTKRLFGDS